MNRIIQDWVDFCENKKEFDKSHFFSLFTGIPDEDDLYAVFKYFPKSSELLELLSLVLKNGSINNRPYLLPLSENRGTIQELVLLAHKYVLEQQKVCSYLNDEELFAVIESAKPEYTSDYSKVCELQGHDLPNAWLFDLISDFLRKRRVLKEPKVYALFESYYGLTADNYLSWFLGAPLIDATIDFSIYFDLWRKGGVFVLTNDKLLVSHIPK